MVGRSSGPAWQSPGAGYQLGLSYPAGISKYWRPLVNTSVTMSGSTIRGRKSVSTAALGLVVLTVYDTALLYNLGHLGARLPVAAAALAVLAAARVAAPLLPRRPPGPGVESITRSFGAFLPLF